MVSPDPGVPAVETESHRRVHRLTTAVRDFRRIASSMAFTAQWLGDERDALEPGQYDVLDRLAERDAWRMGELADALHVDPSAITRTVLALEDRGLADRTEDPSDRRCVLVRATSSGLAQHADSRWRGRTMWSQALESFSVEEIETFAAFMERLTDAFADQLFGRPDALGSHGDAVAITGPGATPSRSVG